MVTFHPNTTFHPEIPVDDYIVEKFSKLGKPIDFHSVSPNPHNLREMNLMLAGFKPASMIPIEDFDYWIGTIAENKWMSMKSTSSAKVFFVTQPQESWRISLLDLIYLDACKMRFMTKQHHTCVGRLLGMSHEDTEEFHSVMVENGMYTKYVKTGTTHALA